MATVSILARADETGNVENIGYVSADEIDPVPANNVADAWTTIVAVNDLYITKGASSEPVYTGGPATYQITVMNLETSPYHTATGDCSRHSPRHDRNGPGDPRYHEYRQ